MKPVLALIGAGLALVASNALADNFTITTDDYVPYTIVDGKNVSGVVTDIVAAALKAEGHTVSFVAAPWARAMSMAESGEATGTMPWFKTPEREEKFLYSEAVIDAKNVIFFRKGGKLTKDLAWESYADLAAYRMGGVIGYWYVEGFKRAGIKLQFVKRDEQNVKKLDAERIDAFITDELVGRALIKKIFPGKEDQFDTVEKPDSAAALYVIVRKGNAAGETMVASLNAGLLKLKESGELKQIVAKYVR